MFITTKDFFFSFYIDLSAVLLQYKNKFNNIFFYKKIHVWRIEILKSKLQSNPNQDFMKKPI